MKPRFWVGLQSDPFRWGCEIYTNLYIENLIKTKILINKNKIFVERIVGLERFALDPLFEWKNVAISNLMKNE